MLFFSLLYSNYAMLPPYCSLLWVKARLMRKGAAWWNNRSDPPSPVPLLETPRPQPGVTATQVAVVVCVCVCVYMSVCLCASKRVCETVLGWSRQSWPHCCQSLGVCLSEQALVLMAPWGFTSAHAADCLSCTAFVWVLFQCWWFSYQYGLRITFPGDWLLIVVVMCDF